MLPLRPADGTRVVVLSGGGLSAASEIPGHRDDLGRWEGHRIEEFLDPATWWRDRELVRRYYDVRRVNCVHVLPNPAHEALARLQHRWGPNRVTLVTHSIDGLLQKAGAADVVELNGSMWYVQCEEDDDHPHVQIGGAQNRDQRCSACGAPLRPDVVWHGDAIRGMARVLDAIAHAQIFVAVGTEASTAPASELLRSARECGARTIEINPRPSGASFDEVLARPAEDAVPELVGALLNE